MQRVKTLMKIHGLMTYPVSQAGDRDDQDADQPLLRLIKKIKEQNPDFGVDKITTELRKISDHGIPEINPGRVKKVMRRYSLR